MAISIKSSGTERETLATMDPSVELLVTQALLSRAADLARRGRYAAAEQILRPLMEVKKPAAATLDLMARIHAQQGRLSEAASAWKLMLEAAPDDAAARAGLQRIERMFAHRWNRGLLLRVAVAAAVLFLVIAVGYFVRRDVRLLRKSILDEAALAAQTRPPGAADSGQPDGGRKAGAGDLEKPDATMSLLADSIRLAGMAVTSEGPAIVIVFNSGLFEKAAELTPQSKVMLSCLGQLLKSHEKALTVRITGCTDDIPLRPGAAYIDNVALGFARANAVADYLRTVPGLPAYMFLLRSTGDMTAPYPNDTPVNRRKNRTAVLRVFGSGQDVTGAT